MNITNIPFEKTGFFSKTVVDYLNQETTIQPFYHRFPTIENFKAQIEEKQKYFSKVNRKVLVEVLEEQYKGIDTSEITRKNIQLLVEENTFTITTGHQLNLFTGPLYFLYKIISAINLCEKLSKEYPNENFVPVYWMASEDHDFEEINYFNFKGGKVKWNSQQTGGVGRFSTDDLTEVFEQFSNQIGSSRNAEYLKDLFEKAYLNYENLADATRYLANELFTDYGLVIIDADNAKLKRLFIPYFEKELLHKNSFKSVSKTIENLEQDYKIQVNPREINLFYLDDNLRERIVISDDGFSVNNTSKVFSKNEILEELDKHPERFSPNVIMRPLYQEVILPNLCYIGGGGELAYWFELKKYFDTIEVTFPILLLRNSVQIASEKQAKKLEKLNISFEEVFLKQHDLIKKKVAEASKIKFDFVSQKTFLQEQFQKLKNIAERTNKSFIGAVNAQERKQIKGLENLEKRLLRAEKRNQSDLVDAIIKLQDELLPKQSLEERYRNFSEYYLEYGDELIYVLKNHLNPLGLTFTVITL